MIETLLQAILEQVEQPKKDLEHNLRQDKGSMVAAASL